MGVSFLELAKSNLAAYLDAQQKDAAHRDARKNGDDIPRHSSLIAEADSVARRVVAESTGPVVHRRMAGRDDANEPSLDREETRRDKRKNALVESSIEVRVAKRRPRRIVDRRARREASSSSTRPVAHPSPGRRIPPRSMRSGCVRDCFTSRESWFES